MGRPKHFIRELFHELTTEGKYVADDVHIINSILDDEFRSGGLINDRDYLMEKIIQFASRRSPHSNFLKEISGTFIRGLWNNLEHPPLSYLGDENRYRTADGSNNNPQYPSLGKAGSYYARTVTPMVDQPAVLPDPGLIFDTIFARKTVAREHPCGISSVLFYLASIIIHDLFRTDDMDPCKHKTSAYLDLAPLYGSSEKEQHSVRTMKDGLLKPDAFAEIRLLAFPPGVCALLICFNRFHNYVAQQLATINEGGRFTKPEGRADDARFQAATQKYDNDLFQTARLVTCGLYVNIILHDYVRTILNLNRTTSSWTLDPRASVTELLDEWGTPKGIGNEVSVEFNLVYRWHSAISARDEEWTNNVYRELFGGKDPQTLTLSEMQEGLREWAHGLPRDPGERVFGDLIRTTSGSFDDAELVNILADSTEDIAGAFGPRNVPVVMKAVECLGMEQARAWKVATLNEFRSFFKLEPYRSFAEISSDKDVQDSLEALYGLPDYVELYPGLVAEDAKKPMTPGSGLCPGFTVSRTILADAVALTRGDRFYTTDYTPANLTSWGFNQVKPDPKIAGGGVIYKLLMRAFPNYYKGNSVYAMFPLVVPEENRDILTDLKKVDEYDFERPKLSPFPKVVSSWSGVTDVLSRPEQFAVPWGPHTFYLTGHDYMLSSDKPEAAEQKAELHEATYGPCRGMQEIRHYYETVTKQLIENSMKKLRNTYQLDAVRDVGNPSHAMFVANVFKIPITEPDHDPSLTATELYEILGAMFAYVFLDLDAANNFFLRQTTSYYTRKLSKIIRAVVSGVTFRNVVTLGTDPRSKVFDNPILQSYGIHMIKRLLDSGRSVDEIVGEIIPSAAAAVATQGQGFAQMLDLYLSDEYKEHWSEIRRHALSDDPRDFEILKRYALEAYRLATPAQGLLRNVVVDKAEITDGTKTLTVHKGDQVYVNFESAGLDESVFDDPKLIKLDRPYDAYIHHGYGTHECLGRPIVEVAMAAQLRVFGRMRNLRRVGGPAGHLKCHKVLGLFKAYMKEDWSHHTITDTITKTDTITGHTAIINGC